MTTERPARHEAGLAAAVAIFLAGASSAMAEDKKYWVSNIFEPLSTPAEGVHQIAMLTLAICAFIFVVVSALMIYTIVKFRRKPGDDGREPPQIFGSNQIELAWTVIPILIVFTLILVTARTVGEIQNREIPKNAERIHVIGHQWWWEVRYDNGSVITANEIHVPLGRITHITLESADVAHSFWVPQLAGKTDVIPNRINQMWIEPKVAGLFPGNCAEFCGAQHANMMIRVYVDREEDFQKWLASQKAPPVNDPTVAKGRDLFFKTACINCHAVDRSQTIAKGVFGPDLTHLMSRNTLVTGIVPNNRENLEKWVQDPETIKPGSLMPDMALQPDEVKLIVDYLMTLK